mmetsp:Transcript_6636/g.16691  ORF Transcript_6636/g.16691 Transcript_6636/m.16691 type:complete len:425 (+) Transcript_6636:93-1367(+)
MPPEARVSAPLLLLYGSLLLCAPLLYAWRHATHADAPSEPHSARQKRQPRGAARRRKAAARRQPAARLEALLASGAPACTAELVAENEFAAHVRLEARAEPRRLAQLSRCLGRAKVAAFATQPASILLAFAWTGEQVRMAMPQRPPPTLASWMALRAAGATAGAFSDRSVPVIAARDRVKFIRQVLFDALKGLAVLHEVGLVHCAIGREVVGISTEDDRQPVKGRLEQLAFARDSETLVLACRARDQVDDLDRPDLLDIGLRERAEKCVKAEADGDSSLLNGPSLSDFAFADDMRAFGALMLESLIVPCAPPGAITTSALAALCDGAYRGTGMIDRDGTTGSDISTSAIVTMDGRVDIAALRAYLMEDDGLRIGGVGGADMLDATGGWDLLAQLLGPWQARPSAASALKHPFWERKVPFLKVES